MEKTKDNIAGVVDKKFANYTQTAEKWLADNENDKATDPQYREYILNFAKHLDSFTTLSEKLQVIALQETLKVYNDFYNIIVETIPKETLQPVLDKIKEKHSHQK